MPAYNEENYIEACIASVQAQDYPRRPDRDPGRRRPLDRSHARDPRAPRRRRPAHQDDRQPGAPPGRRPRRDGQASHRRRHRPHGRPLRVRARLRPQVRRDARAHRRRQRRRRAAREGQDVLPARPVRRAREPARRRRRQVPLARTPKASSTPSSSARSAARCSRRSASGIPARSPTRTPSSTSASSSRGGQIYLSRDIVVHYFPRDSFKTLAKQYYKYGRGRARTLLKLGTFPTLRPRAAVPHGRRRRRRCSRSRRSGRSRPPRSRRTRWRPAPKRCGSAGKLGPARHPDGLGDLPGAPRLARRRLRGRPARSTCASPTGPSSRSACRRASRCSARCERGGVLCGALKHVPIRDRLHSSTPRRPPSPRGLGQRRAAARTRRSWTGSIRPRLDVRPVHVGSANAAPGGRIKNSPVMDWLHPSTRRRPPSPRGLGQRPAAARTRRSWTGSIRPRLTSAQSTWARPTPGRSKNSPVMDWLHPSTPRRPPSPRGLGPAARGHRSSPRSPDRTAAPPVPVPRTSRT